MSGGWASWLTEVYCIMFTTQLVYISSPLHLTLKDHCTNWRTLNKVSGQILWPFIFFISIFVVLVLLFSLTFYNFHGQNYLNALKISIYGIVNNDELGAQCQSSQRKSSYAQVKEQVQFLSIYTLKFISCLNLMKICIYHLEHACIEHKSYVMCTVLLFCSLKEIMTKQYVIFLVCSKKKRNDKK